MLVAPSEFERRVPDIVNVHFYRRNNVGPTTVDGITQMLKTKRSEEKGDFLLLGKSHPNLVQITLYTEFIWGYSLLMEKCDLDLFAWCEHNPVEKYGEMREVFFSQTLVGLRYLHSLDLIHEDIKINNILIKDNVAKLCDFEYLRPKTLIVDEFKGCLYYASPEKIANKSYDERADLWSLGVTFYEVFAGHMYGKPESIPGSLDNKNKVYRNWLKSKPIVSWEVLPSNQTGEQIKRFLAYEPEQRIILAPFL